MRNQLAVIITVEKNKDDDTYCLRHNQMPGFKGVQGRTWGRYTHKKDALADAGGFMRKWNKLENITT